MKNVLIIAYYFPPAGGGGVQRTVKFAKYLSHFGWRPYVLTVREGSYSTLDDDLVGDVPRDVRIFRITSLLTRKRTDIFRRRSLARHGDSQRKKKRRVKGFKNRLLWMFRDALLVPDVQIEWVPFVISAGLRLVRRYHIDAVYTTGGPFSTFLAGYALKKLTGKPWVADFRDAWMQCSYRRWESRFRRLLEGHLERLVVNNVDRIITVSKPMKEYFLATYPDVPPWRYEVIPNGFDPDDFRGLDIEKPGKFTICYTGRIGHEMYSPEPFFHALSLFIGEDRRREGDIEVVFSGVFDEGCDGLISRYGLEKIITRDGYIPHRRAIQRQRMAHVLLLLFTADRGGEEILTGKLLEYLNHDAIILALISQQTEAARLISKTQSGTVIDPDDVHAIKQALADLYRRYRQGDQVSRKAPGAVLQNYSRIELTGRLAEQLDATLTQAGAVRTQEIEHIQAI